MNYKEYILFIYLYIAYSDFKLEPSEVKVIRNNLHFLFNDEEQFNEIFQKVWQFNNSLEKREAEEIIMAEYGNMKGQEIDVQKILSDLEEIMESDGIVYDTEVVSFNKIKSLLA